MTHRYFGLLSVVGGLLAGCSGVLVGDDGGLAFDSGRDTLQMDAPRVEMDAGYDGGGDGGMDGQVEPSDGGLDSGTPSPSRPRLLITTDIGGDPDDEQSMVRLLVYANEFDIEGLVASSVEPPGSDRTVRPALIHSMIDAYAEVRDSLENYAGGFPEASTLHEVVGGGSVLRGESAIGEGLDTEGSQLIEAAIVREDPRPLDIAIWGGQTDLGQALYALEAEHGASALAAMLMNVRVHDIADQDGLSDFLRSTYPPFLRHTLDLAQSGTGCESTFRGMFLGGDLDLVTPDWISTHVKNEHGPLGALYPDENLWSCGNGINGVKEGDTPSWFSFLPHGLADPYHPEWGGFGGRFEENEDGMFRDAADDVAGDVRAIYSVSRWRPFFQNDFEARMDACVGDANHAPELEIAGSAAREIVRRSTSDGALSIALGASDADGDMTSWEAWIYHEPSIGTASVAVEGDTLWVRGLEGDAEVHVVLQLQDDGSPSLATLRRVIVSHE